MVRIPAFARRSDQETVRDGGGDEPTVVTDRRADARTAEATGVEDKPARARAAVAGHRVRDRHMDEPTVTEPAVTEPAVVEPPMRARASVVATLSLILGVVAAAAVATGVLAVPGVALGVVAVVVSVIGFLATARPHVAGRFDAGLGLVLSLAAVVVGLLALGNAIVWPNTDANQVAAFADWLRAELPWLNDLM